MDKINIDNESDPEAMENQIIWNFYGKKTVYERMHASIVINATKLLQIVNICTQEFLQQHELLSKEIDAAQNGSNQNVSTRKLKQYSKLSQCLPLWLCSLDIIYQSLLFVINCDASNKQYKLWTKYVMAATKAQNKVNAKQFAEASLEMYQCVLYCQQSWR